MKFFFPEACRLAGGSKQWIKIKNRKHHAFDRVQEAHRAG
jgi:hypothetical protein